MRILHISDTHGCHRRITYLPDADVLVHSGDISMYDTEQEIMDFLEWLCDLPYTHKIFICGNHDILLEDAEISGFPPNVHFLRNSGVEIDGVKFHGISMFINDATSGRLIRNYANIPEDTDVLITHEPPYGIMDLDNVFSEEFIHNGSPELLQRVQGLHLRAHLFGHIHRQHGIERLSTSAGNETVFSNGAIMNDDYTNLFKPNIIEI